MLATPVLQADEEDRIARQQALDEACEAARAKKLAVDRRRLVAECMRNKQRSQADCEAEFSTYGERTGTRPPLYYELPECVAAADFQRSTRRAR